jgi:hypothetical protein
MNDLTALTPPFLMAAAVITAIVMFLRHEMRRGRAGRSGHGEDAQEPGADAGAEPGGKPGAGAEADGAEAGAPARDR